MRILLFFFTICSFSLFSSDKVFVTPNSMTTLDWVIELIDSSHQSIEIANPFLGDEIGLKIMDAIEKRMKNGNLRVHLLVHPVYVCQKMRAAFERLDKSYPGRFFYLYTNEVPCSEQDLTSVNSHIKLMIFDEKYYVVGGTNFFDGGCNIGIDTPEKIIPVSMTHFCSAARDNDVIGTGDVAAELRKKFFQLYGVWEKYENTKVLEKQVDNPKLMNRYFPLSHQQPVVKIGDTFEMQMFDVASVKMFLGTAFDSPNKIAEEYLRLINTAKNSISIGNLFFHPQEDIMEAFFSALNRGVKLQVITNGIYDGVCPNINVYFAWANRMSFTPLFYARYFQLWQSHQTFSTPLKNTKIYEYYVKDTLYHKKTMVVDNRYLVIGSFNLGLKSRIGDYELILVIDSPQAAQQMIDVFELDKSRSREVTVPQANAWFFDPWTAYLGGLQKKISGFI